MGRRYCAGRTPVNSFFARGRFSGMDAEIAVVGAGVVGSATALELARRGVDAVLLEAERTRLAASGTNSNPPHRVRLAACRARDQAPPALIRAARGSARRAGGAGAACRRPAAVRDEADGGGGRARGARRPRRRAVEPQPGGSLLVPARSSPTPSPTRWRSRARPRRQGRA